MKKGEWKEVKEGRKWGRREGEGKGVREKRGEVGKKMDRGKGGKREKG